MGPDALPVSYGARSAEGPAKTRIRNQDAIKPGRPNASHASRPLSSVCPGRVQGGATAGGLSRIFKERLGRPAPITSLLPWDRRRVPDRYRRHRLGQARHVAVNRPGDCCCCAGWRALRVPAALATGDCPGPAHFESRPAQSSLLLPNRLLGRSRQRPRQMPWRSRYAYAKDELAVRGRRAPETRTACQGYRCASSNCMPFAVDTPVVNWRAVVVRWPVSKGRRIEPSAPTPRDGCPNLSAALPTAS